MTVDEVFLTPDEIASRLRVPRKTVYRWHAERHMPGHRLGPRLLRFCWAEVDAWVRAGGADTIAPIRESARTRRPDIGSATWPEPSRRRAPKKSER